MEPKGPAAFIAEFVGTFFLVLGIIGVMGTAVDPAALKGVAGIAIGGALGVGVLIFATGAWESAEPPVAAG